MQVCELLPLAGNSEMLSAVRSELMFLLYKNPDIPLRDDPELAPVGRFF